MSKWHTVQGRGGRGVFKQFCQLVICLYKAGSARMASFCLLSLKGVFEESSREIYWHKIRSVLTHIDKERQAEQIPMTL